MGLFISETPASEIDGGANAQVKRLGAVNSLPALESVKPGALKINSERLNSLKNQQSDLVHILNIGEAIGAEDFEVRCEMDTNLTKLAIDANENNVQEIEIAEFLSTLPSELSSLVDLLDAKVSEREIAKMFGVAKGTIQYRIEKLRSITRAYFASAAAA